MAYNNTSKRHALIPSSGEVGLFSVAAFTVLVILEYGKIMQHYGMEVSAYDISERIVAIQGNLDANILPDLATMLVWAAIGLTLYLIAWLVIDSGGKAAQATSRAQRFIYPSKESKHVFMMTIFGQLILRGVGILALVVWGLGLFKVISWASEHFYQMAVLESVSNVTFGLAAIFVIAGYMFLAAAILRLIFLRPRVFSD